MEKCYNKSNTGNRQTLFTINNGREIWGFDQQIGADLIDWIRHGKWSDRHWKEL